MQLHQLQPAHRQKTGRRIGRGGKKGTYSGRGMKGQKARSGARMQPRIRELIKKYPKLRGGHKVQRMRRPVATVDVGALEKYFEAGATVTPLALMEKRLVRRTKGRLARVKLLASGDVKNAFAIKGCEMSAEAKAKIEKAGGTVE